MRITLLLKSLASLLCITPLAGCMTLGDASVSLSEYLKPVELLYTGNFYCSGIRTADASGNMREIDAAYSIRPVGDKLYQIKMLGQHTGHIAVLASFYKTNSPYLYIAEAAVYNPISKSNPYGTLMDGVYFVAYYQENADGSTYFYEPFEVTRTLDTVARRFGVSVSQEESSVVADDVSQETVAFLKEYQPTPYNDHLTTCKPAN